tara:strand:+ start:631 stop:861 length:231 start_codon:yes stop_codon:yes gene_type:complete
MSTSQNSSANFLPEIWRDEDKNPLTCIEKIKILNENIIEINQMANEAFEDGMLMGTDPNQIKSALKAAVENLNPSF